MALKEMLTGDPVGRAQDGAGASLDMGIIPFAMDS